MSIQIMNPMEHGTTSNNAPLSKILRKRKNRRSIAHSGLRDIQESRFEQHFYTIGRSSLGSGAQWVTTKQEDFFEPEPQQSENTFIPSFTGQEGSPEATEFLENVNLRGNKFVKNIKASIETYL